MSACSMQWRRSRSAHSPRSLGRRAWDGEQVAVLHALCEWQLEDIDYFRDRMIKAEIEEDESWVRDALAGV